MKCGFYQCKDTARFVVRYISKHGYDTHIIPACQRHEHGVLNIDWVREILSEEETAIYFVSNE